MKSNESHLPKEKLFGELQSKESQEIIEEIKKFNHHLNKNSLESFGADNVSSLLKKIFDINPTLETQIKVLNLIYLKTLENRDKSYIYIAKTLADYGDKYLKYII